MDWDAGKASHLLDAIRGDLLLRPPGNRRLVHPNALGEVDQAEAARAQQIGEWGRFHADIVAQLTTNVKQARCASR